MKKLDKKQRRAILEYSRATIVHEISVDKDIETNDVDAMISYTKNLLNINGIKAGRVRLCIFKIIANQTDEIDTTFSRLTTDLLLSDPVFSVLLDSYQEIHNIKKMMSN